VSKANEFKDTLRAQSEKAKTSVEEMIIRPKTIQEGSASNDDNANGKASTNPSETVNLIAEVPVAAPKKGIRETHTTKAFYIRNDIAELINEDIRKSKRGAMTEIANALFEQYYRSQGRLK